MKKNLIKKITLIIITTLVVVFSVSLITRSNKLLDDKYSSGASYFSNTYFNTNLTEPSSEAGTYEEYISMSEIYEDIRTTYELNESKTDEQKQTADENLASLILSKTDGKLITIGNATELFLFSNAQSVNFNKEGATNRFVYEETINTILSLNYILTSDIDYSKMGASRFVPIGTNIFIEEGTILIDEAIEYDFPFNGSFDGRGYEIKGLQFASYAYITSSFQDENQSTFLTVANFKQYAMFNNIGETGVLKNFSLVNPRMDIVMNDASSGLIGAALLAGVNKGTIVNVSVIDDKKALDGSDISGLLFSIMYPGGEFYQAAGFAYENRGTILNSFFIAQNVVSPGYAYRFNHIAPFIYINSGVVNGVVMSEGIVTKGTFYNGIELDEENNEIEVIKEHSITNIINGNNGVNLNKIETNIEKYKWYHYPQDGYPKLIGLKYVDGVYEINDGFDLTIFSKLITFNTPVNGKTFDLHTYVLKNDINMKNITYHTPKKEFKGILKGGDTDFTTSSTSNTNKYIYNLELDTAYIVGANYYMGLLSILSGKVLNINILNTNITIKDSLDHYGKTFYVGAVSGRMNNGEIRNVISNAEIDLGSNPIGSTYLGGLVGYASGKISLSAIGHSGMDGLNIDNPGKIDGGVHKFNNLTIAPQFYVGGIVGANNDVLEISEVINEGDVYGVGSEGSSTENNYQTSIASNSYVGGIIGDLNNSTLNANKMFYLRNNGTLYANNLYGTSSYIANQYVGGIFGSVRGYGFSLSEKQNGVDVVRSGRFQNYGDIIGKYTNINTYLYAGSIAVAQTNETLANFSYMTNNGSFNITGFDYKTNYRNIFYASTVVDKSTGGVTLSRAYNETSYEIPNTFFTNSNGADPDDIKLALFFTKVNDNIDSKLIYVENKGNLTIGSKTANSTAAVDLKVSNITQATRVDYYNVINSGDITLTKINNVGSIYVAGITWVLPYHNRNYKMHEVINKGKIITADILGDSEIDSYSGVNYNQMDFTAAFKNVRNLYVAGLVNLNVGEVINVMNTGDITSTYSSTVKDIDGKANTFVGGINTFNYNLIQDAANTGIIEYTNSNTSANAYFAGVVGTSGNVSKMGGLVIIYESGLTLAGIVAGLGDLTGTEVINHQTNIPKTGSNAIVAEVKDTINSGDVYGKAKEFVRSGGVLGVALSSELSSGTNKTIRSATTPPAGPFTTAELGDNDPAGAALLSNGLNYGNIYAITQTIGIYNGSEGTGSGENDKNSKRPGINSSAGGVVAYGLTRMVRMLNHGVVVATDVAGGIVGATFLLGYHQQSGAPVTEVDINTAVHYGQVKAAKTTNYNSFSYLGDNETFSNTNYYYEDNNTFIFPVYSRGYDIRRYPNDKRGFGGIFGRLQRGRYGSMRAISFSNIMNMDENIDLIGRADSNIIGSQMYYRFYDGTENYFTAREDDTTMFAIMGWMTQKVTRFDFNSATVRFTITRQSSSSSNYYISKIEVLSGTSIREDTVTKQVVRNNGNSVVSATMPIRYMAVTGVIYEGTTNSTGSNYTRIANFGLTTTDYNNGSGSGLVRTVTKTDYNYRTSNAVRTYNEGTEARALTYDGGIYKDQIQKVSDVYTTNRWNIFDSRFPLAQPVNAEYIYPVEEDSLADRFRADGENAKPHGMYVLASSLGSLAAATLPTNINISGFYNLDESTGNYIDVTNPGASNLVENSTVLNIYENELSQLKYNNASAILDETISEIADLTLYDPSGLYPTLQGGTIDHDNKTVTYKMSRDLFASTGSFSYYYEVESNILSNNAIIADGNILSSDWLDFRNEYADRVGDMLESDSDFRGIYEGNATNFRVEFDLWVYSQLSIMDENMFNNALKKYRTKYTIIIETESRTLNVNGYYMFNGGSQISPTGTFGNNVTINTTGANSGSVNPNGSFQIGFAGTNASINALFPTKHQLDYLKLEYNTSGTTWVEVDLNDYELEMIKKGDWPGNINIFGVKINLDETLKSGSYRILYKLYDSSQMTQRTVGFTKAPSQTRAVIDVNHPYFSNDLAGLVEAFQRTSETSFNTYTYFGYSFEGVTTDPQNLTVVPIINNDAKDYQYNISYYEFKLNGVSLLKVKVAPFSTISQTTGDTTINYSYNQETGKIEYNLSYRVLYEGETGTAAAQVRTHKIIERDLEPLTAYLNDNLQPGNSFTIAREALLSLVDIDFHFINYDYYQNITMSVNNSTSYDEEEIYLGDHLEMFNIFLTEELDVGTNSYSFTLDRDGHSYNLGSVDIEKVKGSSAYLLDVKFTLDDSEAVLNYPEITPYDSSGNPLTFTPMPRMDYEGIDYSDTKSAGVQFFRIDGKVSDIVLESYHPRFSPPAGALVERYIGLVESPTELAKPENWTTDLYDDYAEEGYYIIHYRVTSEDGLQQVHYYITATDIKYNLTLRFKIMFELEDGTLVDANTVDATNEKYVLIESKNLELDDIYEAGNAIDGISSFPTLTSNMIVGLENQSTLFQYITLDPNQLYRFGRNMTGAYNFNVITPKYKGEEVFGKLTPGQRYHYDMYMVPPGYFADDEYMWYQNKYKLPSMNIDGYVGRYYYILAPAGNPITREIIIVIRLSTQNHWWGMYDDYTSFD